MSTAEWHRKAEAYMADADILMREGREDEARRQYFNAAEWETLAFSNTPVSKPRTRGILAVSVVALYAKSNYPRGAIEQGERWLAAGDLPPFAVGQIAEMIAEIKAAMGL